MKRILLGAVLCFFSSMQINAQSFSEEQLDGEWKLTSQEVDFNDYIGTIKLLKFGFFLDKHHDFYDLRYGLIEFKEGELIKQEEVNNKYFSVDRKEKILDYFVVGDNRLHIIVDDQFTLRFKILEVNGNTLRLQGPKGVMSFTKVTTSVQQAKVEQQTVEKARYNIKGQKIAKPERGINIIQMSDNSSHKEMVR
ncbi:hypothetical protein [Hoylesella shahii]